jgi:type IV pilus assembly protein PilX
MSAPEFFCGDPVSSRTHLCSRPSACAAGERQRGAVLVVSLLLLIVITLLGLNSMRMANFDVALATNVQARGRALAVAENGLAEAEDFVFTNHPTTPTFDWSATTDDGLYMPGELGASPITAIDWSAVDGAYQGGASGARYSVEYLGVYAKAGGSLTTGAGAAIEERYLYLITAQGQTASGSTRYVQSVFATSN